MKKTTQLVFALTIIILGLESCEKSASGPENIEPTRAKGKLLREHCSGAVIQILSPGLNIGDPLWEDRQGSPMNPVAGVYNNVVNAANICTIREDFINKNIIAGDTLYFDFKTAELSYFDNGCIICTGIELDMPFKKIKIYNISKK